MSWPGGSARVHPEPRRPQPSAISCSTPSRGSAAFPPDSGAASSASWPRSARPSTGSRWRCQTARPPPWPPLSPRPRQWRPRPPGCGGSRWPACSRSSSPKPDAAPSKARARTRSPTRYGQPSKPSSTTSTAGLPWRRNERLPKPQPVPVALRCACAWMTKLRTWTCRAPSTFVIQAEAQRRATGTGCGFGSRSFRRQGKPAVEAVEDGFDGWPYLVGDLVLALAFEGAASGFGDDDLEHAGQRDPPQPGGLGRHCLGLGDSGGQGGGLAV